MNVNLGICLNYLDPSISKTKYNLSRQLLYHFETVSILKARTVQLKYASICPSTKTDKQFTCLCNGMLLKNKKETTMDMYNNRDESQTHYLK